MGIAYKLLYLATAVQLPVWLLVGLNSLAFQVHKELAYSAAYFAGLALAWWSYRNGHQAAGLALIAVTLLVTLYFWHAIITSRPL